MSQGENHNSSIFDDSPKQSHKNSLINWKNLVVEVINVGKIALIRLIIFVKFVCTWNTLIAIYFLRSFYNGPIVAVSKMQIFHLIYMIVSSIASRKETINKAYEETLHFLLILELEKLLALKY